MQAKPMSISYYAAKNLLPDDLSWRTLARHSDVMEIENRTSGTLNNRFCDACEGEHVLKLAAIGDPSLGPNQVKHAPFFADMTRDVPAEKMPTVAAGDLSLLPPPEWVRERESVSIAKIEETKPELVAVAERLAQSAVTDDDPDSQNLLRVDDLDKFWHGITPDEIDQVREIARSFFPWTLHEQGDKREYLPAYANEAQKLTVSLVRKAANRLAGGKVGDERTSATLHRWVANHALKFEAPPGSKVLLVNMDQPPESCSLWQVHDLASEENGEAVLGRVEPSVERLGVLVVQPGSEPGQSRVLDKFILTLPAVEYPQAIKMVSPPFAQLPSMP
ncbi:hypothetical protein ACFL6C_05775 [Myxococcota bacterium]